MKVDVAELVDNFVIEPIGDGLLLVITDDHDRVTTGAYFETQSDAQAALNLIHVLKLRCGLTQKARVKSSVRADDFIEDFKATIEGVFV